MTTLTLLLIVLFSLFLQRVICITFSESFTLARKIPIGYVRCMVVYYVTIAVILSVHLIKVVLLVDLLALPRVAMGLFASSFGGVVFKDVTVNFLKYIFKLILSCLLGIPSKTFVVLILILFFLVIGTVGTILGHWGKG